MKEETNSSPGGSTADHLSNDYHNSKQKKLDLFDILVTNNHLTSSNNDHNELFMYETEREINRNENPVDW